jgi:hypothetical protein
MRSANMNPVALLALWLSTIVASRLSAQAWASRFPPQPDCSVPVPVFVEGSGLSVATLKVSTIDFETDSLVRGVLVGVSPVGQPNPAASGPAWSPDYGLGIHYFEGLAPGRYTVVARSLATFPRTDTITVASGGLYELRFPLEGWHDGYRNIHNCRPRRFRRDGESACVTTGYEAENTLDYARDLSRPKQRETFKLPPVDTTRIALVDDEATCELAGRNYGRPDGPPRRVVVVRMDSLFLVYDPFEPVSAGEWDIYTVFDASWRPLVNLAS